ncbi:alpha-glucosidase 2 [Ceratitis capitata]|uniref:alpha-glucosidase 2 n=1 Tax=Ceratitis capitata TaxID=7213 RepID=UPI000329EC2C|nr:alpha-glucosidase 2 [Ceratitis capitata]
MARQRRNVNTTGEGTNSNHSNNTINKATKSDVSNPQTPTNNKSNKNAAKHKKGDTHSTHSSGGNSGSSSSTISSSAAGANKPKAVHKKRNSFSLWPKLMLDKWKTLIGCVCLAVASYFCYLGYLETRVNTPFDNEKMVTRSGLDDPERYWGSYRPLTYFGMKTRDPHSLVMGLMWYSPMNLGYGGRGLRHWCEIDDNLGTYGWTQHDGRTFGVQEIQDAPFELKTSFIKFSEGRKLGGDWTARISVRNITSDSYYITADHTISLIWYVALDERTNGHIQYVSHEKSPEAGIFGETIGLGEFKVLFQPIKGKILHKSYLSTIAPSLSNLKDTVFSHFRIFSDKLGNRFIGLPGEMISQNGVQAASPNFIAIHITAEADFTIDIVYQSTSAFSNENVSKPPTGREFTNALQEKLSEFDHRFEDTFHLRAKGYSVNEIKFAKYAVSNLVGGIGYFYGASRVKSVYTKKPVPYWKAPLYTSVPSRSFFPRGFLWDEGFQALIISSWDLDIALDIMCHWFDLLNIEGWIPREQILGVEALAKVPEEFVVQHNTNANPPTFFLTLDKILTHHKKELSVKGRLNVLDRLYPRLQTWFAWYNNTQRGDALGTYYWRGRNASSETELNPKTLTSGLDDFPRASHPTNYERHVDLRCWIALAARVMCDLSDLLGKDSIKYYETATFLADNKLLNKQHLSPFTDTYADFGLHTDSVALKRPQVTKHNLKKYQQQQLEKVRVTLKQPEQQFVDTTYGYVNLFPFLLQILDHDSEHLGKLLKNLRDPNMLWTNYGLRSLAKKSPLYMKRNTEHDAPYWRGPIWININYLAIRALHHYGTIEGPYSALARTIYIELRDNVVGNIYREYKRTGYLWEQYDDSTGQGKGCYPFTGWTSLVVLIMSEQY